MKLGRVHDGDYFGEVAFFEANNTHTYSIKTDSHCHLETLLYTDLATLMKLHIEIAEQVQASARVQARLMQKYATTGQQQHNFEDKYDRISKEKEKEMQEKEEQPVHKSPLRRFRSVKLNRNRFLQHPESPFVNHT
jgi:hypothetical protein